MPLGRKHKGRQKKIRGTSHRRHQLRSHFTGLARTRTPLAVGVRPAIGPLFNCLHDNTPSSRARRKHFWIGGRYDFLI